jgi:hypothetical protein
MLCFLLISGLRFRLSHSLLINTISDYGVRNNFALSRHEYGDEVVSQQVDFGRMYARHFMAHISNRTHNGTVPVDVSGVNIPHNLHTAAALENHFQDENNTVNTS